MLRVIPLGAISASLPYRGRGFTIPVVRGEIKVLEPVARVAGRLRVKLQGQAILPWRPVTENRQQPPDRAADNGVIACCQGI